MRPRVGHAGHRLPGRSRAGRPFWRVVAAAAVGAGGAEACHYERGHVMAVEDVEGAGPRTVAVAEPRPFQGRDHGAGPRRSSGRGARALTWAARAAEPTLARPGRWSQARTWPRSHSKPQSGRGAPSPVTVGFTVLCHGNGHEAGPRPRLRPRPRCSDRQGCGGNGFGLLPVAADVVRGNRSRDATVAKVVSIIAGRGCVLCHCREREAEPVPLSNWRKKACVFSFCS